MHRRGARGAGRGGDEKADVEISSQMAVRLSSAMLLLRLVPRSFPRLVRSVVADAPAKKWPARTPYKRAVPAVKAAAAVVEPVAAFDPADASEEAAELDQLDLTPMHDAAPASTSAQPAATSAPAQGIPTIQDYPTMPFPLESSVPLGQPAVLDGAVKEIDWTTSFHGLSAQPFSERAAAVLMRELKNKEIEIKPGSSSPRPLCHPLTVPDGILYLPEILYRRKLNEAFGPGGWGMVPRGEMTVVKMMVSREWSLIAGGRCVPFPRLTGADARARLVSVARGEQAFFDQSGLPTATEGCKSNALMRCCKDLGIASELWYVVRVRFSRVELTRRRDPSFIRAYKATHCVEAWTEHVVNKKKYVLCCGARLTPAGRSAGERRRTSSTTRIRRRPCEPAEARAVAVGIAMHRTLFLHHRRIGSIRSRRVERPRHPARFHSSALATLLCASKNLNSRRVALDVVARGSTLRRSDTLHAAPV